ncbi:AAA-16 domain-containing protein [Phanerochaete sordida]|uniref:AAA-16 domain-containing protein n=1 Tax=Phanerochaete sordida TaxID=48140 RepID=A0A9P3FY72_9APHY|nr:AAA-16 domain-containing protein [Phanerochaete sordida]
MSSQRRHEVADLVIDHAPAAISVLKAVLELSTIPGLGLIAEGLSAIVERVADARTNHETEVAFLDKVSKLVEAISEMKESAKASAGGADNRPNLRARLSKLASVIIELRWKSEDLKGGRGLRGSVKCFLYSKRNEAILTDMNRQLADALAMFQLRGQVDTEIAVNNVAQDMKQTEERKIIYAIPHASAGYHSVDELKSEFLDGTRKDLFDGFEHWASPLGYPSLAPKPLYFLSGSAGLGKSSIAHQLCTRITGQWGHNLGASFFFCRGHGDLEIARMLFPTFAHQLALSQPALRSAIARAAEEFFLNGEQQQMRRTFDILLKIPLAKFTSSTGHQPVTFLVIDGLDECKDRELVPDLLRSVLELVRAIPWLRVFIAARPEPHILPVLASGAAADVVYHRSLNGAVFDGTGDVGLYLRAIVPKIHGYDQYIRDHPDAIEALTQRARGVFIYARTAVQFLETYDDHPEEQFQLLLASSGAGLSPLDELYLQVLRYAFPPKDLQASPSRHGRLHALLTFLALRLNDLPPSAIALLLGLSEADVVWTVDRLRSVLLVDAVGDVVPLHATFAEFLVDPARCVDAAYHVARPAGHAALFLRCLAAFNFETATRYLRTRSEGTDVPLARYMHYTKHWRDHLIGAEHRSELQQPLQDAATGEVLPILIRLHGPDFVLHGSQYIGPLGGVLKLYPGSISHELVAFGQYAFAWWILKCLHYDGSHETQAPVVPLQAVAQIRNRIEEASIRGPFKLVPPADSDAERYNEALEAFSKRFEKARAADVWCN